MEFHHGGASSRSGGLRRDAGGNRKTRATRAGGGGLLLRRLRKDSRPDTRSGLGQARPRAHGKTPGLSEDESGAARRQRREAEGVGRKAPRNAARTAADAAAAPARVAWLVAGTDGQRTPPVAGKADALLAWAFRDEHPEGEGRLLHVP